ncbi:putative alpha-1,2-mannosyltransferase [Kalaharituber pfeilii]|nr:putative alpha-1,2-mannosyltransferase [Kalaharituber pfeilii]
MGLFEQISYRIPSSTSLPPFQDFSKTHPSPRLAFFKRRVRLKGSPVSVPFGVILILPLTFITLILILIFRQPSSSGSIFQPTPPPMLRKMNDQYDSVFHAGCLEPEVDGERANAAFVVLARNKELEGVVQSLKSIERHFNRWFHYPYVFLNDVEFNSTFKETVLKYVSSPVEFGTVNSTMWGYPDWVNKEEAEEAIARQGDAAIMYGGMASYHHMCHFYSGYFYKHELLQKYKWYWRLEPEVNFFCDITYDPFIHMERANKTYGWVIAVKELRETVPNLFRYASAFKRTRKIESKGLWEMFLEKPKEKDERRVIPKDGPGTQPRLKVDPENMENESYNMCHFWSNFEIARFDFFRSREYEDFFQMLEQSGGFWQERWGDAPVHSLAAGVLLGKRDVHYFRDIGYRHTTIQHCPNNAPDKQLERTPWYDKNMDPKKAKEEDDYWANWDRVQENGVGCRCRCDQDYEDVEGTGGSCLPQWVDVMGGWAS